MVTLVGKEGCDSGSSTGHIVVGKLSEWKEFVPIVLLVITIDSDVLFYRSEMQFHIQSESERVEEMGDEFRSMIRSDMAWNSMLGEDVKNEELCKLLRCDCVMSRNEESLLGETINNNQYSGITGR